MLRLIIFFLAFSFFAGCQSQVGSGDRVKSPVSGYEYIHHIQTDNRKAAVGDFIYFKMALYTPGDSLLQSMRNQDPLPAIKVAGPDDINRKRNPMLDILAYLAVGDSATIIVPLDSIPGVPPQLESLSHIEYRIVPVEVLTNEEQEQKMAQLRAEQEAAIEETKKDLPRVESLTERTLEQYKAGTLELLETPNGVQYVIHEKGTGDVPLAERRVTMHYYGRSVSTGQRFDDSYSRGRGYTFRVANDSVITGWHEIAPFLPVGTKASVFIPSNLGYGERGSPPNIGPGETLYFYMEPVEVLY